MKIYLKLLLFSLVIIGMKPASAQSIIATRTASLIPGDYATSGTVHLELYDDNSLKLRFESDYLTQSNVFDVHVFLTNNSNYSAPIDTTGLLLVEDIGTIDGINYSSGAMTFNLPVGTGIDDFDYIVFVCVEFGGLHWANGVFSSSTLGIESTLNSSTRLFPTISSTGDYTLTVGKDFNNARLIVSDMMGQVVLNKQIQGKNSFPFKIEGEKGNYIIRIISENQQEIARVVKL